jgi:hypothetical protein
MEVVYSDMNVTKISVFSLIKKIKLLNILFYSIYIPLYETYRSVPNYRSTDAEVMKSMVHGPHLIIINFHNVSYVISKIKATTNVSTRSVEIKEYTYIL